MAKRYHGGEKREKMLGTHDYYSGYKARERMEHEDGGMIMEDHSAIANLPQNVMMKPYARPSDYLPEELDDTIHMIDGMRGEDHREMKRHLDPKKI